MDQYRVVCQWDPRKRNRGCWMTGPQHMSEEVAVQAWNRIAAIRQIVETVAGLDTVWPAMGGLAQRARKVLGGEDP